jgi:hypothetical protein
MGTGRFGRLLIPLLSVAAPCHAAPPRAETIREFRALLGDPAFPLQWRETSMNDGRPLVMSILERDGLLGLSFAKTDEGLWAEGAGVICVSGAKLEARFTPGKTSFGPAAHWALRYAMAGPADFTLTRLDATRLRIATLGWTGVFAHVP